MSELVRPGSERAGGVNHKDGRLSDRERTVSDIAIESVDFTRTTFGKGYGRQTANRKEEVYESLRNWIIYSRFEPGAVLSERDLAARFGLGRTPLREILQRLSYQQLIIIKPRKGIQVAPIDYFNIKPIFEVRVPIEAKAAALAARRAAPKEIKLLRKIVTHSYRANNRKESAKLIRLDQIFHETLGDMSRNPVLRKVMDDLHGVCLRFWFVSLETVPEDIRGVMDLDGIVDAIEAGDQDLAAELNARHVERFVAHF